MKSERAEFVIPAETVNQILAAIDSNRIMKLHRSYDDVDTFDGIWESISIKQGGREKHVFCRNHFPEEFVRVAALLRRLEPPSERDWREVERPMR